VHSVIQLIAAADVLIDPFRPGTTERLGLGPDEMLERNPRLIYGRITGWGQTGPWAGAAGHDLNYISLAGPLSAIGRKGSPPPPPLNLIGDFGGGGMLLALGIAAALVERATSGRGQVVDAAMVDGAALQFSMIMGFRAIGLWSDHRESNLLDGGAPFYDTYETADGRWVSIAALEPQFYAELLTRLGLDLEEWPQYDRQRWHALRNRLSEIFASRTRDQWTELLGATDACFAPVLTPDEAAAHPQNMARQVYQTVDGVLQPAPAPRFSRTPGSIKASESFPGPQEGDLGHHAGR
jgi:alpha-methylacyl-CoA racemase